MKTRICPNCNEIVTHTRDGNCATAHKNKKMCSKCYHESLKERFKGEGNPFFGKTHTKESREIISKANKNKVISLYHRDKLSLANKGENNSQSTLTEKDVSIIKSLLGKGVKSTHIANYFGVGSSTIYRIRDGQCWTFIFPQGAINFTGVPLTRNESYSLLLHTVQKEDHKVKKIVNGVEVK